MSDVEAKAAFTPGPWRWHGYYLMQDCPPRSGGEGKEDNPFSTPCGHPIADDGSAGGEYSEAIDINGPDAHLIAAAPDLYEALDKVIHELCGDPASMPARYLASLVDDGIAALAKARGEK